MARLTVFAVALFICLLSQAAQAQAAPTRPIPAIEHVVVISIDGARPDCVLVGDTPTLRGMIHDGAYTMWAKTTAVSITLPSHVSMVTGVSPNRHGIMWNGDLPLAQPVYPAFPTMMELATKAGYVTAMIAGKPKFAAPLAKPGTVTHVHVPAGKSSSDEVVAAEAVATIEGDKPGLTFIHFPELDAIGHAKGWGSTEQIAHLAETDRHVHDILAALERADIRRSTLVIVTADHGGAGLGHGADDPRSRHIPWIAVGPGVRHGFDLTQRAGADVRTEDTFATVCYVLGLTPAADIEGHPVLEAFEPAPAS